jgi:hypothetical protein
MEMGEERGPVSDRHLIKLIVRPTLCAPSSRSPEVEVMKSKLIQKEETGKKYSHSSLSISPVPRP